jgi:hypothetical protein
MAKVLESGDIYFVFRPRIGEEHPEGLEDVQRFFVVLSPRGKPIYRRLVIGRKRLPDVQAHERVWGFVDKVARRPKEIEQEFESAEYQTATRGERHLPAGRPAGEGVYAIVEHEDHTHLAYELELPEQPGEVQEEFDLEKQGSYIVAVKNPEKSAPPGVGLPRDEKARFPKSLEEHFAGRRFVPLEPDFLDREGAELVLIGASEDVSAELGIELAAEKETAQTAEIFNDLRMERDRHPLAPLFEGVWE